MITFPIIQLTELSRQKIRVYEQLTLLEEFWEDQLSLDLTLSQLEKGYEDFNLQHQALQSRLMIIQSNLSKYRYLLN